MREMIAFSIEREEGGSVVLSGKGKDGGFTLIVRRGAGNALAANLRNCAADEQDADFAFELRGELEITRRSA